MARFFFLPFAFLLFALTLAADCSHAQSLVTSSLDSVSHPAGAEGSVPKEQCPAKCEFRCSQTSHRKPCLFYCNYCCVRCLCVPSGTYGNREECPCYNNIKTKKGKHKCP